MDMVPDMFLVLRSGVVYCCCFNSILSGNISLPRRGFGWIAVREFHNQSGLEELIRDD